MKRSIFYLDDEAGCLNLFQETFGGEYDVRTATTVSQARCLLAERPADIVISDQNMPELSGIEFLREVALSYPASFRVLVTGHIRFGEVIYEVGAGIIHLFIPKPWAEQDMWQMLERASLHPELRRAQH